MWCLSLHLSFSLLLTLVCGAGNLTRTRSPACWSLHLSFSLLMTVVCGAGNLTHTTSPACLYILLSFSLLLTIVCGAGNLTHTISPAYLLITPLFSLYSDATTANRYSHITLLQEVIHGFRNFMLLATETLYMFSYRTVGIEMMVIVVLTYCLPQLQHHAPGVLAVVSLALRSLLRADLQLL